MPRTHGYGPRGKRCFGKRDWNAIIVMDNAAFHKRADTKAAIEKAGHRPEYLPPYSPDLNPIKHKWAQAKAIGRKTAKTTKQIFESELSG